MLSSLNSRHARFSTPLNDCFGRSPMSSGARRSSTVAVPSRSKRWSLSVSLRVASAMAVAPQSGSALLRDAPEQEAADERGERRGRDGVLLRRRADLNGRRVGAVGARLARLAHELGALVGDVLLDLGDLLLGARLDVCLLGERGDGVAQVLARALDVGAQLGRVLRRLLRVRRGALLVYCSRADCARVFTHRTSSFVVSTACSGTGGVASFTCALPRSARTPAIAP